MFKQGIGLVGCMAHIRPYLEKAFEENKTESEHVLLIIRSLYQIEYSIWEQEAILEERKIIRAEKASALVQELEQWAINHQNSYLPKSLIGKAVT